MSVWNFKHAEVRRLAKEVFGVEHPVELRVRRRRAQANGFYTVKLGTYGWHVWRTDKVHDILLCTGNGKRDFPIEHILRTLAHELRHAWQAEQFGHPDAWSKAYRTAQRSSKGKPENNEYERDARAAESRWHTLKPTINERRTA